MMLFRVFGFLSLFFRTQVYSQTTLAPKKFLTVPLGNVKPAGWLMDQLVVQTNGLAGHLHEFYAYASQTDWTGGTSYYSNLEEAGSYWFNAMVPNGVLVNNSAINAKTSQFLSYVLSHQDTTGWLGPEVGTTKPRLLWGRYPFLFGAMQMTEVDPTLTNQVVTAMHKFVAVANTMLKAGEGVDAWAATRWEDFVLALQWLYDFHPNGNEALLIDTMQRLKWTGVPWEKVFSQQYFPTTAVEHTPNPFDPLTWHGVNMAEGLKALPSTYRFTHNQSDLDTASKGWDMLFQYHGRPSGIFAADEYLAGLEAVRGTELCLVVETMFSGSYLYQVIGDPKFADRVERITYNALPATLTGDMWSRQYLQQQNQIGAKNMNPNPFPNDGSVLFLHGRFRSLIEVIQGVFQRVRSRAKLPVGPELVYLITSEPLSRCCTVNHPQGWPKFISNAFLTTPDQKSLVHLYLGPFVTSVTLASNNKVTATVDTIYPFSDTLTTTITATQAFTYFVRIPSWVVGGTISINGATTRPLTPSNGLQSVSALAGTTKFVLNLPADIKTESRPHGSIAVQRGPLHYAFDIPRSQKVLNRNAQQTLAVDLEFDATAAWQYAIDPATLKFNNVPPASGKLPSPIFDSGKSPSTISVTACPISWATAGDTFAAVPPTNPACTGAQKAITLAPYGTTKLRIGEFPTFRST